eukprot:CAMPEP_0179182952 /NCGR_PEP_ID=MMETSP0796-20121207/90658_1 /TAXON_ID=73915 /ORGANISM="Pyrodinium bahamense, Strain pbaha01" /LENGTH=62 /DNA_ID=CAMNT_0020886805 /DNA_START=302 /DNA_END=490 /DNA_ORIENTATION=-
MVILSIASSTPHAVDEWHVVRILCLDQRPPVQVCLSTGQADDVPVLSSHVLWVQALSATVVQ